MALPKSVLITGCNRGIGLGLVKEFLKGGNEPSKIIATCRNKAQAKELMSLEASNAGRLKILELEVANYQNDYKEFVEQVETELGDKGLNLLINNAGIMGERQGLDSISGDNMIDVFRVNCVGPTLLTRALLPFLKKAASSHPKANMSCDKAAIVQMSTVLASISVNEGAGMYTYRCSKSALNMSMKNTAIELGPLGILVMAIHPGWVSTDMGGPNAHISVDECVSRMTQTILQLGERDHGSFLKYDNTPLPW